MKAQNRHIHPASFRDPAGFVFTQDGVVYRQVNPHYAEDYRHLMESGLYDELAKRGLLIQHTEVPPDDWDDPQAHAVLLPEQLRFISYPYEWCFSQLKDAAIVSLEAQTTALQYGMILKDCNAHNVQFHNGKPVLVDTLSFAGYKPGDPWDGYRQFCQHFLVPLSLMSRRDQRLQGLLALFPDGIPLALGSRLLPPSTWLSFNFLTHIHFHAKMEVMAGRRQLSNRRLRSSLSEDSLTALSTGLLRLVKSLEPRSSASAWSGYAMDCPYSERSLEHKAQIVSEAVGRIGPHMVWDLGANEGRYSRIATQAGAFAVSIDGDPEVIESNYRQAVDSGDANLLPLVCDLRNPWPSLGWANQERASLLERGPADMVLALALVHHLVIGSNIPIAKVAHLMGSLCTHLLVEFVPKHDPKIVSMLSNREDIFPDYHLAGFKAAFGEYFSFLRADQVVDTDRTIFLLERKP